MHRLTPLLIAFTVSSQVTEERNNTPRWFWWLFALVLALPILWWWIRARAEEKARRKTESIEIIERDVSQREPQEAVSVVSSAAASAPVESRSSEPQRPDDLKRIEGIGPKISAVLQEAGIRTFAQLAETEVGRLEQILRGAGIHIADPTTWPDQAALAAAGQWDALAAFQDALKGGRRV
jgi:predicted flap endonuclease-1-like 5' DNA nuclease